MNTIVKTTPAFLSKAEAEAAPAQLAGRKALTLHNEYTSLRQTAADYDTIFATASPFIVSLCCIVCAIVDAAISMDIYKELLQYGLLWIIADIGVIILAFKTGHYLRSISSEEVDLMEYEEERRSLDLSVSERKSRVAKDIKKDKRMGYAMLAATTLLVAGLSYHRRVGLLGEPLSILDAMPVVFLFLTALSSIHLFYCIKRLTLAYTIRQKQKQYAFHNNECRNHSTTAIHYYGKARQGKEDVSLLSQDLKDTMQRFLTSSSLDYTYAEVQPKTEPVQAIASTSQDVPFEELQTQIIK